MKIIIGILHLFLFVGSNFSIAQTITATVYDYDTQEVIIGASVYYDGTTFGDATDVNGQFEIEYKEALSVPIIISFIGYTTLIYNKETLMELAKVYLKPSPVMMDELVIVPDNWSREKKLKIFKAEFLGRDEGAELCRIVNEKKIELIYNPATNKLYAHCNEPLIIRNRYLGYEIKYDLMEFEVVFDYTMDGLSITKKVYYSGTTFFAEIGKGPTKKQSLTRVKVFEGSELNFMRSLANGELGENRFEVFYRGFQVDPYQYFSVENENLGKMVTMNVDTLSVLFHRTRQSSLILEKGYEQFYLDDFGVHYPPKAINFLGDFGYRRIASMLPQDFGL